jgi:uncharacterized repeat protein (TIGR04052 family)
VKHAILAFVIGSIALLGAAGVQATRHYTISFAATVGEHQFSCATPYPGLGTTRATITPQFLRFYVSNVRLVNENGAEVPLALDQDGTWQQGVVGFVSFEGHNPACASGSPQDHRSLSGSAPPDRYVGLRFTLGVPQSLDHADATIAASPLNLSDMFWSWQDGYKFFRFDGRVRGANGRTASYVFHLGSTGCSGDKATQCAHTNEVNITLRNFDPSRPVLVDIARLVENANLEGGGCMMMSSEECSPELRALGIGSNEQTVFRTR